MKKSPLLMGCLALALMFSSCDQPQSSSEQSDATQDKSAESALADGSYNVDIQKSRVEWKGTMVGMYSHSGTLSFESGKIGVQNGKVTAGEFVVDMNSMVLTDDNYDPKEGRSKEKLVEHLQSDDFFLVSEYPTARFSIKAVDGQVAKGEMTIRGNTNSVAIENIDIHAHDGVLHITGTSVLNRQNYDVKFSHPVEEMVLSNDLEIKIDISATHNK